jgi:hypothetical protein
MGEGICEAAANANDGDLELIDCCCCMLMLMLMLTLGDAYPREDDENDGEAGTPPMPVEEAVMDPELELSALIFLARWCW